MGTLGLAGLGSVTGAPVTPLLMKRMPNGTLFAGSYFFTATGGAKGWTPSHPWRRYPFQPVPRRSVQGPPSV